MAETVGQRLRRLRQEQGFTVSGLAAVAGTTEGTIRHLELDEVRSANVLLMIRLADALHVEIRFLATGEGSSIAERFDAHERRFAAIEKRLAQHDQETRRR